MGTRTLTVECVAAMQGGLDLLHSNDRQGEYPSSWYVDQSKIEITKSSLEDDVACDVCIIGAGFTGLSAALELSKKGYKVIVLEAHRVGWGASGRNGGQVGSGQRQDQDYLEEHYGLDAAKKFWQAGEEAKTLIRQLIKKHKIKSHAENGIIHADHRKRYLDDSKAYVDKLNRDYNYHQIRFIDGDKLETMVKSEAYYGGSYDEGAFHINPLGFALGLAKAAEKQGVIIHENSKVIQIKKGSKVCVKTAKGSVTSDFMLLACNGYLGDLEPKVANQVLPINNFVITTEPLGKELREQVMPTAAAIADSKFVVNYFRMTHDGRMLFGGGENYGYRFPQDIKRFVQKPMLEIFPQLAQTRIDYGWGGTLAITMKRLPLFVRVSDNILNCSGYSGHGVAMATLAGKIASQTISGQAEQFDLFAKLDTPRFPGGTRLRYPMLVLAMIWFSLRDKF